MARLVLPARPAAMRLRQLGLPPESASSSKALTALMPAQERHNTLALLSAPEEGFTWRKTIKNAVRGDEKFESDPRA